MFPQFFLTFNVAFPVTCLVPGASRFFWVRYDVLHVCRDTWPLPFLWNGVFSSTTDTCTYIPRYFQTCHYRFSEMVSSLLLLIYLRVFKVFSDVSMLGIYVKNSKSTSFRFVLLLFLYTFSHASFRGKRGPWVKKGTSRHMASTVSLKWCFIFLY